MSHENCSNGYKSVHVSHKNNAKCSRKSFIKKIHLPSKNVHRHQYISLHGHEKNIKEKTQNHSKTEIKYAIVHE